MRRIGDREMVAGTWYKAVPERAHGMCYGCDVFAGPQVGPCGGCYGSGTILRRVEEKETTMNETEAKPAPEAAPAWELRVQTPCSAGHMLEWLDRTKRDATVTVEGSMIVVRP